MYIHAEIAPYFNDIIVILIYNRSLWSRFKTIDQRALGFGFDPSLFLAFMSYTGIGLIQKHVE